VLRHAIATRAVVVAGLIATGALVATADRAPARPVHAVAIEKFRYQPAVIRVKPGETITWRNGDNVRHTVTSPTKLFDSGYIEVGGVWTMTAPATPGDYPYECTLHPNMTGQLQVAR
jgi:plastocyanin